MHIRRIDPAHPLSPPLRYAWIGQMCLIVTLALSTSATADAPAQPSSKTVDHTKPEHVLDAVFLAARTEQPALLNGLCDPLGEGDGDTRRLCSLTAESPHWPSFLKAFKRGSRISPIARQRGNRAKLNFLFGPKGVKAEEMNLIQRDGKWYLFSF